MTKLTITVPDGTNVRDPADEPRLPYYYNGGQNLRLQNLRNRKTTAAIMLGGIGVIGVLAAVFHSKP